MKVINIMASSLDGKIASTSQEGHDTRKASGLSSDEDHRRVTEDLKRADGVIVGAESIRAVGGVWEQINDQGVQPPWVIFTQRGLAPELLFWQQTRVPRVLIGPRPLISKDPNVSTITTQDPVTEAMSFFRKRKAKTVLLFGGGNINALFYQAQCVDELKLCLSPLLIGTGPSQLMSAPLSFPIKLKLLHSDPYESQLFLHYRVEKTL